MFGQTDTHQIVDIERSAVASPSPVYWSHVPGPVFRVICSCGWRAHADDVNVYAEAEQHFGRPLPW
jgi:hypothetical protein